MRFKNNGDYLHCSLRITRAATFARACVPMRQPSASPFLPPAPIAIPRFWSPAAPWPRELLAAKQCRERKLIITRYYKPPPRPAPSDFGRSQLPLLSERDPLEARRARTNRQKKRRVLAWTEARHRPGVYLAERGELIERARDLVAQSWQRQRGSGKGDEVASPLSSGQLIRANSSGREPASAASPRLIAIPDTPDIKSAFAYCARGDVQPRPAGLNRPDPRP